MGYKVGTGIILISKPQKKLEEKKKKKEHYGHVSLTQISGKVV